MPHSLLPAVPAGRRAKHRPVASAEITLRTESRGERDLCDARVRERFPDCKQIVNAENRGFAAAANQAIRVAHGECIALCNPDAFLTPDYIASANIKPIGAQTQPKTSSSGHKTEPRPAIPADIVVVSDGSAAADRDSLLVQFPPPFKPELGL